MYINGIQSVPKHSRMTMFADDMAFYCHENSPTDLQLAKCGPGSDYILATRQ